MLPRINIFGLEIRMYYVAMLLGVVLMFVLMINRQKLFKLKTWQSILFVILITVAGIFSAKLLFIIEDWDDFIQNGLTLGGFSFFGAFYFVPPFMALCGLMFHLKPYQSMNAASICGAAQVATMRFGCFLNGCCGGVECKIGDFVFTWPAQVMESALDFTALLILLKMEKRGVKRTYPWAFLFYGSIRFVMEFFRNTPKQYLGLSEGHWFSLIAIIIGLIVVFIEKYKNNKKNTKI